MVFLNVSSKVLAIYLVYFRRLCRYPNEKNRTSYSRFGVCYRLLIWQVLFYALANVPVPFLKVHLLLGQPTRIGGGIYFKTSHLDIPNETSGSQKYALIHFLVNAQKNFCTSN